MSEPAVRPERTAWRDQQFSERHRLWGWDCPAEDVDFLMIEYDTAEPRAIMEYKHESARGQTSRHPSYEAISRLADRGRIPFFAVRYADDLSWWIVTGLNGQARGLLGVTAERFFSEIEYVRFLYERIRGRPLPREVGETILGQPFVRRQMRDLRGRNP